MADEPRTYDYGSYFLGPIEVEPAAVVQQAPAANEIPPADPVAAPPAPESPRSHMISTILSSGPLSPSRRGNLNSSRNGSPAR